MQTTIASPAPGFDTIAIASATLGEGYEYLSLRTPAGDGLDIPLGMLDSLIAQLQVARDRSAGKSRLYLVSGWEKPRLVPAKRELRVVGGRG